MSFFWLQLEYHGQQDDLEQSEPKNVERVDTYREIEVSSKSVGNVDLVSIEAGDHLFFEDLSLFKPVKLLLVGSDKKSNSHKVEDKNIDSTNFETPTVTRSDLTNFETSKIPKSDSVQDYLTEIDRQYFGAVTSKSSNEGWRMHKIISKCLKLKVTSLKLSGWFYLGLFVCFSLASEKSYLQMSN